MKCHDLYAMRGSISKQNAGDAQMRLPGDSVTILRGTPPCDQPPGLELLPVYSSAKDATPAVVTKRIFLRLQEDTPIDTVRGEIEALDFRIDDVPAHAPHCAWLEPKSGRVDDALGKLDRLRALPRAAHAEPQLLRPRGWKRRI